MSAIKTTYRNVEIEYVEHSNSWTCELFTIPADTLCKAKERINKHLDNEKKKPFKRFNAFVRTFNFGSKYWPLVEVTSITDDGKEAWCSLGGKREKLSGRYGHEGIPIYPDIPENALLVEEIHKLTAEIKRLESRKSKAEESMTRWKQADQ